jgi:hypothetical protein
MRATIDDLFLLAIATTLAVGIVFGVALVGISIWAHA